jgi:hypothetical protein
MNLRTKRTIFSILIILLGFTSCRKELSPGNPDDKTIQDIQVSDEFSWKTTRDIQLTLTGNTDGIIEVANDQGIAYQKAFLTSGTPLLMKLTLPAYEDQITLKFSGQEVSLGLDSEILSYQFN